MDEVDKVLDALKVHIKKEIVDNYFADRVYVEEDTEILHQEVEDYAKGMASLGRRFMALMNRQLEIPLLHLRGAADPYVLADPVERTRDYAPRGRFVTVPGAGHYAHEEAPVDVNREVQRLLTAP